MNPVFQPLVILSIALGGALGSVLRYFTSLGVARLMGTEFPWGTLLINVAGSFIIGIFAELLALRWNAGQAVRAFLVIGICGGYTTFSSFALDFSVLFERGSHEAAILYAFASVVLSILALFAAMGLVRVIG